MVCSLHEKVLAMALKLLLYLSMHVGLFHAVGVVYVPCGQIEVILPLFLIAFKIESP
jgi:hypothetical protein